MKTVLAIALWVVLGAPCAAADPLPYRPSHQDLDGNGLFLVYFGGNGCAPCKAPGMLEAVIKARDLLAARAAAEHRPFSATGVALDHDVDKGLEFLKKFGAFDQVVVGKQWFNDAVLDYMIGGPDALLAIPQVIVYERELKFDKDRVMASPPKIRARIPGTGIPLWVNAGAKLRGD